MTTETQHSPGPWRTASKPTDMQGLIVSDTTGENIAVCYEAKNAPIISASTEMLEALEWITRCTKIKGPAGTTAYIISAERMRDAVAAVAKAKGEW